MKSNKFEKGLLYILILFLIHLIMTKVFSYEHFDNESIINLESGVENIYPERFK